jgi:hypothetical protein
MLRPMELKAASASDTVSWGPGKSLTSRIRDTRPSLRPVGNAMKGPPDCETTRVPQYYDQFCSSVGTQRSSWMIPCGKIV